jgi:hypothetical protein
MKAATMTKHKKCASFDDLPAARKEEIWQECEQIRPAQGKALTVADWRLLRKAGIRVDDAPGKPATSRNNEARSSHVKC